MACNGHNHPPDCSCAFRGGHAGSVPPTPTKAMLLGDLAPPIERRRVSLKAVPCPRCGRPTYFVPGPRGGSYTAGSDGLGLKHRCPKAVPAERLKYRQGKSQKGWLEASVASARKRGASQALRVTSLVEGGPFRVEVLDGLKIDPSAPVLYRWAADDPAVLELAYLDPDGRFTGTVVRARRV